MQKPKAIDYHHRAAAIASKQKEIRNAEEK
jgi:hypothetical protein